MKPVDLFNRLIVEGVLVFSKLPREGVETPDPKGPVKGQDHEILSRCLHAVKLVRHVSILTSTLSPERIAEGGGLKGAGPGTGAVW